MGHPPKVLYIAVESVDQYEFPSLPIDDQKYIEENYLTVKPNGEILNGLAGFQWWALKTKQHKNFRALAHEYTTNHASFKNKYRNEFELIEATFKIKETFGECFLDHLFYQEFYSLPKFGKTKAGQMVSLGKSGQDINSIQQLAEMSKGSILRIIKHYKIDGVIFTPHSIPRKIAFLKEFKRFLSLSIPCTELTKIFADNIPVAQKSLSKLSERIENAGRTIFTREENKPFKRILVIDDAVGSGATMNAIAEKLKRQSNTSFVCGFAVTGSLKGFEVIKEI
ncbi:MAG: hypothetical protein V3V61_00995 [Gammaproteobacteria bacterium]